MKPPTTASNFFSLAALAAVLIVGGQAFAAAPLSSPLDIRTLGAVGDGKTLNTKALQSAIDQCHAAGGGTVLVTGGRYVTGTLYLKSHVNLRIDAGSVILGSPNIADYSTDTDRNMYRGEPYMDRCLIFAHGATDISIEGQGTIDGQGKSFPNRGDARKNRPKLLRFLYSSRIRIRDIKLQAPASWTTEWRYCDDIAVDGITIFARANSNGDGLDFDGCTKVRVSNSSFDTSDDSICLQTSLKERPCRDVVITNCHFSSRWAGMRIGLLSRGDFENILVSNCTFRKHDDSGLKIQMNEGAEMKNMIFSNLIMRDVPRPVFLTFCQQRAWVDSAPGLEPMKRVRNIQFNNIIAEFAYNGKNVGFVITGMPGFPLENISFSDIRGMFPGGGTAEDAKTILSELTPDNLIDDKGRNRWPEFSLMRGTLPAQGLYARHVKGLTLRNVQFETRSPDARPAVVLVDVTGLKIADTPEPVFQILTPEQQAATLLRKAPAPEPTPNAEAAKETPAGEKATPSRP